MSEAKNHITVDQDSSVGDILINVHEKKVDIIKSLQKYINCLIRNPYFRVAHGF